jgi:beta-glucosidase
VSSKEQLHIQRAHERAVNLVAQMTEDEKFSWLSGPMAIPLGDMQKPEGALGSAGFYPGIVRLGIPALQQSDASLGIGNLGDVRPGDHATGLPSSLMLGATFNPSVAFESGVLVGREASSKGFNVQLAGGANPHHIHEVEMLLFSLADGQIYQDVFNHLSRR